ncbi:MULTISPECIES: UTP--glucose-1-phosphate uridylyltransferase GalU [Paenibacillus]|uniref:UTP--glucose-1-phosphate uridylyltransferase n=1 Tax=Paenibacillus arenosi TaxID=2774142 RepID=A0ABR9AWE7_9BACL|nr:MULTISPECIES: UTP--glucose-1-phosphate uridylyltransferase GalU [Paenibacillus]MBD8498327.1 UTP--glucose-1-phosphate uridylyltransferase GalU [Paenibacillus arenosi]
MKVRKAIIPAAGLGTRFLPATKAQPKEMLPIVDKPTIQYIVEEAIASGIEDIMIISGRGKRAIEDHFDKSFELEESLAAKGNLEALEEIQQISKMANIHYIRQKEPKGLGHAILCARTFIGNEPFAVLLGDDIVQSEVPCIKQLMDVFDRYHSSVVGVQYVPDEDVRKYGIIDPLGPSVEPSLMHTKSLVEKPPVGQAPSNYAIMGRYILRPEIFEVLEHQQPGAGNEIQLTDAIMTLNQWQAVLAYEFQGTRYDVGDKLGFLKATVDFALRREELSDDMLAYLIETVEQHQLLNGTVAESKRNQLMEYTAGGS